MRGVLSMVQCTKTGKNDRTSARHGYLSGPIRLYAHVTNVALSGCIPKQRRCRVVRSPALGRPSSKSMHRCWH